MEILLATLLTRADQIVPTDRLINEIWGDNAPRRALASVHVYVSQLRKLLSRSGQEESPIRTRPPGYLLALNGDQTDGDLFLDLVARGRVHAKQGRYDEALSACTAALGLWRGPVLDEVRHGPLIDTFITWLMETRLECLETRLDADLMLGRHRELVGELFALTAKYPFREPFYRHLMLALYRSERQADALKIYQVAWRTLDRELGVQPCRRLQNLQQAILRADERLHLVVAPVVTPSLPYQPRPKLLVRGQAPRALTCPTPLLLE
jgi:DNA-binding SARP family transcriptional activator